MTGKKRGEYSQIMFLANNCHKNKYPYIFEEVLKELDIAFDKNKDFGEMYNFLNEIVLGNGSEYQPQALKELDVWSMSADYIMAKVGLNYPCLHCKRLYPTRLQYGCCYDNDGDECWAVWMGWSKSLRIKLGGKDND